MRVFKTFKPFNRSRLRSALILLSRPRGRKEVGD